MMTIKSYAKINLGLEVLYKRADGYHEINTVFTTTCLYDSIEFKLAKELQVSCFPSLGIPQEQNLVFKAGKLLQKKFDCKSKGADIKIIKKIPDGAGLGGGSSNAANTLSALNKLWNINVSKTELMNIALELGSDVPFFIGGKNAVGKGKGEILEYFDLNIPYHILLVLSNIKVSTKSAYQILNKSNKITHGSDLKSILKKEFENPLNLKELIHNDFEYVIFEKYPELAEIKEKLYLLGADFALMSGSGSSIFSFFKTLTKLENAEAELKTYQLHKCINSRII